MATPSTQLMKKIAAWGIPIAILIGLIVLLLLEITDQGKEEVSIPSEPEISVLQPTEEVLPTESQGEFEEPQNMIFDNSGTTTEPEEGQIIVEELPEEEPVAEEEPVVVVVEPVKEVVAEKPADPEFENSYIVEEGDNLWKIAKKQDVLDDPWKWKTILVQNRDKINYTIVSADTGKWTVMVDPGKRLVIKPKEEEISDTSFNKSRKKRYALQLMSLNLDQLKTAIDIVKFLINDGYYAYLYRTREKIRSQSTGTLQYFYRIRVGFFENESEARKVGAEILEKHIDKRLFSNDYWAVLPSYRELSGELIDFGIQRTKPWIIQVSERKNRADAIDDLGKLTSLVEFAYISQKKVQEGGFRYRIRAGFYETREEAQTALNSITSQTQGQFTDTELIEIHHVMESAPGQSTGATTLNKVKSKSE
jgi:cell division septation protein DedD